MFSSTRLPIKKNEWSAIVTRADGTVEDLGVIAYWHRNPLRRWAWRIKQFLRGRKAGQVVIHR